MVVPTSLTVKAEGLFHFEATTYGEEKCGAVIGVGSMEQ
jgi:hypothetical protein